MLTYLAQMLTYLAQISADTWASIATAVGTAALALLTWWLARSTIREGRRSTGLQLFSQMVDSYQGGPMRELRKRLSQVLIANIQSLEYAKHPDHSALKASIALRVEFRMVDITVWEFFENMGRLVRAQALDTQIMWNYFSDAVLGYWTASSEMILNERRRTLEADLFTDFEWLADAFAAMDSEGRRVNPARTISPQRVREFLDSETRLFPTEPVSFTRPR